MLPSEIPPEVQAFLLKTLAKKAICHVFGVNELFVFTANLAIQYIRQNEELQQALLSNNNNSDDWELAIARCLNENLRKARLEKLEEDQRKRDEFWQQRDAEQYKKI
ncbi:hypothetical protein [Gloeothece verrucosa]|uniref:Uncharacterized protein n=1 Tax=Gloeothece verrucosa (strain PCC 7822) TaxID=497965 RepID=E0UHM0_GLOV7|nr:hypothetical protein [Gloeothece verrucosa]ADN13277.1 hypothetical protein Cyan7822_1274 [Gloeothece verrucosa PCC 7822]